MCVTWRLGAQQAWKQHRDIRKSVGRQVGTKWLGALADDMQDGPASTKVGDLSSHLFCDVFDPAAEHGGTSANKLVGKAWLHTMLWLNDMCGSRLCVSWHRSLCYNTWVLARRLLYC